MTSRLRWTGATLLIATLGCSSTADGDASNEPSDGDTSLESGASPAGGDETENGGGSGQPDETGEEPAGSVDEPQSATENDPETGGSGNGETLTIGGVDPGAGGSEPNSDGSGNEPGDGEPGDGEPGDVDPGVSEPGEEVDPGEVDPGVSEPGEEVDPGEVDPGEVGFGNGEPNCEGTFNLPQCVSDMADAGGGTVILAEGTYLLTESLDLENDVNIVGQGPGTVIAFDDSVKDNINEPLLFSSSVDDIELKDFKLQCSIDQAPNSSDFRNDHMGLFLDCSGDPTQGQSTGCNNIYMERIEATECSNGMHLKGVTGITGIDLHLHHNGNTTVDLFHNVYFRRVRDLFLKQTSPTSGGFYASNRGHGLRNSQIINAYWEGLTVFDNADHGTHLSTGIFDMRWHNVDIRDNCASPNGGCNQDQCYTNSGTYSCSIDRDAPQENINHHDDL